MNLDCRQSLEAARQWAKNGRFYDLLPWLKSEKPRQVLHGCFALSFVLERGIDEPAEAALDALTQALTRFQQVPIIVASIVRTLSALAFWAQQRVTAKDKLASKTFQRLYTAIGAQPENDLVLLEFAKAMNLLYSGQGGFKNQVDKAKEYLYGAALHVNTKVAATATSALCRMTWLTPSLSEYLLQRVVEEFGALLRGPWVPNRNVRLVRLLELLQGVLTSGGSDRPTFHERTVGGQKVPGGDHDAVIFVPLKQCRDLIDAVLDKTLHTGNDIDEIRGAPVNDCALGDVYRATLQLSATIVRIGGLPLVMERTWLTNLVLTLCTPVDIQVHYVDDVVVTLSAIVDTGFGVLFGAPLRKLELFIENVVGHATDPAWGHTGTDANDSVVEPRAKRARRGKHGNKIKINGTGAQQCRVQWRRTALRGALRLWNCVAQSALIQRVQPSVVARIHEVVVRTLWLGQSEAHTGLEEWLCDDVEEMLKVLEIASVGTPELRRVALGLSQSLGERGRRVYERLWRRDTPCGPAYSHAYTEAMSKAVEAHAQRAAAKHFNSDEDTPSSPPTMVGSAMNGASSTPSKMIVSVVASTLPEMIHSAKEDASSTSPEMIHSAKEDASSTPPEIVHSAIKDAPLTPPEMIHSANEDAPSASPEITCPAEENASSPLSPLAQPVSASNMKPPHLSSSEPLRTELEERATKDLHPTSASTEPACVHGDATMTDHAQPPVIHKEQKDIDPAPGQCEVASVGESESDSEIPPLCTDSPSEGEL